jgi:hypothetical protein
VRNERTKEVVIVAVGVFALPLKKIKSWSPLLNLNLFDNIVDARGGGGGGSFVVIVVPNDNHHCNDDASGDMFVLLCVCLCCLFQRI